MAMSKPIQERLRISDIYLASCNIESEPDLLPKMQESRMGCQFKRVKVTSGSGFKLQDDDGGSFGIFCFYVDAGMRFLLAPGGDNTDKNDEPPDESETQPVAEITARFVAEYRIMTQDAEISQEDFAEFANTVRFHATPYVREFMQAACNRMRLPPVPLPMLNWNAGKKPEKEGKTGQN